MQFRARRVCVVVGLGGGVEVIVVVVEGDEVGGDCADGV